MRAVITSAISAATTTVVAAARLRTAKRAVAAARPGPEAVALKASAAGEGMIAGPAEAGACLVPAT